MKVKHGSIEPRLRTIGNDGGQVCLAHSGIDNKMVLAQIGRRGWVVAGSLNGGEVSARLNREMALKVASNEAYSYITDMFWYDWKTTP